MQGPLLVCNTIFGERGTADKYYIDTELVSRKVSC